MNKILSLFFILTFALTSHAVEMGVPVQLKFKNPAGVYPDASGITFSVQVLTPTGGCVLYEEDFANQTVVSGTISLALGSGTPAGFNPTPNLSLTAVYENLSAKNNLTCVNTSNVQQITGQTYNPTATDTRVLRVRATILGDPIVADFIQRATPYALHAESVGGKVAADILVQNGATSLNQANLESLLSNATKFNKLSALATNGVADSAVTATSAGTANYFTANLLGDVTGTQSATVVAGIRGVAVGAVAPVSGQILAYDGSQYIPMTVTASAPVASVNGQLGAVVLTSAHIAGVVTSASPLLGDVTGNVSATVVSTVGGKSAASITATVNDVYAATANPTNSTIAKRDGSGGLTATMLTATTVLANEARLNGARFYEGTNTNYVTIVPPAAFADYQLTLPTSNGNPGEVLQTDGSGVLSWGPSSSVTSSSITTALGYTAADSSLVVIRANNLSDLTSATVARTNLGLGGAALLNVGTAVGTVAAGDDSRITGALSQTAFNTYVAGGTCTSGQSMYWNSVTSLFACQNIILSGDVSGLTSTTTVTKVQGVGVSFAALANNNIIQYNGSNFVNRSVPTCAAGEYLTFNGTTWSCATDAGGGGTIASLSVTAPISSTGGANPTISMAQANGSANGYLSSADWTTFNNKLTSSTASILAVLGYTPADSATVSALASTVSGKITSSSASISEVLGYVPANPTTVANKITSSAASISEVLGYVPANPTTVANKITSSAASIDEVLGYTPANSATLSTLATTVSGKITSSAASIDEVLGYTPANSATLSTLATTVSGKITSSAVSIAEVLGYTPANSATLSTLATTVSGKITSSAVSIAEVLGYIPASATASAGYMLKANNLSDLASATVARANLGLSAAATMNVGTGAGTLAAGDDSRITGALSQTAFNTYVASGTCSAGQSMYWNSVTSLFACQNILLSGDVSGIVSNVTVTKVQGVGVSITALANNHILQHNGSNFVNRAVPTCGAGEYLTFNGTTYSCAVDAGGGGAVTSISVTAPLSSTGGSTPTLSILQASGSADGYLSSADWTTFNNKLTSSTASIAAVLGYTPANSATVSALATTVSGKITSSAASIDEVLGYTPANSATVSTLATTVSGKITSSAVSIAEVLGYVPASATASAGYVLKASNLSDLASATVARTNLGLGSLATLSFIDLSGSQASGTLAAARLPAFTGDVTSTVGTSALALASVGSGVTSGTQYTKVTVDGKGRVTSGASLSLTDVTTALGYTPANNAASGSFMVKVSNLSDLASSATARTNLGLGGAAVLNVGTSVSTVAAGDDARITGAVQGASFSTYVASASCTAGQTMYWNSVTSNFLCQNILLSGDVTGIASNSTVTKIQGVGVSFATIATGHILQYNGTDIINRAVPTCTAGQYMTFNGTTWSCVADIGTAGIVSSVAVTSPLQSTGGSAPTLSMTQATGSVSGYLTGTDWTTFNNKITSSAASVAQVLGFSPANSATTVVRSLNLSDLLDVVSARANLGLGGFATVSSLDLGSASATGTLATARLPAFTGDVSSTAGSNSLTVTAIQGTPVSSTVPTTGQLMVYNGSAWTPTTSPDSYVRTTADQALTNTGLVNVTSMTFTVVSGVAYKFKFNVLYQSSATTNGLKVTVTVPAGAISANAYIPSTATGDGTDGVWTGYITASADPVVAPATPATATTFVAFVEGVYVATANGNLQLQFAAEAGGGTITLKPGTNGHLTTLP